MGISHETDSTSTASVGGDTGASYKDSELNYFREKISSQRFCAASAALAGLCCPVNIF
jgi:hypothetical protein